MRRGCLGQKKVVPFSYSKIAGPQECWEKLSPWCLTLAHKGVWRSYPPHRERRWGNSLKHLAHETRVLKEIPTVRGPE